MIEFPITPSRAGEATQPHSRPPGYQALEHAVSLMMLGNFEGNDPVIQRKLALRVLLAADLAPPLPGQTGVTMIATTKKRVVRKLVTAEPDLAEDLVGRALATKDLRSNWTDWVREAYAHMVINGIPVPTATDETIQQAIIDNTIDFDIPDSTVAAA